MDVYVLFYTWGMGITQSDEYCEIYERFMEEYLTEFDEQDGVLHDVYFAIGKAEWMCGGISEDILEKISIITKNGENVAFCKEPGATEHDLILRQRNLERFLHALSVPRGKTKKENFLRRNTQKSSSQDFHSFIQAIFSHIKRVSVIDCFA